MLDINTWNHLTVCKWMRLGSLKSAINKMFTNHIYLIRMYKQDLALNNLQWLICHKTKPNLMYQAYCVKYCSGLNIKALQVQRAKSCLVRIYFTLLGCSGGGHTLCGAVIIVGNGTGDPRSNPGWSCLH